MRAFRAALRPRSRGGRKPDQTTSQAAEIFVHAMNDCRGDLGTRDRRRLQREVWQSIYLQVFPEFRNWDRIERHFRTCQLRRNVKGLLSRRASRASV
jgi:hypothetical protein